jgi:lysylphosphatidylglycerol synthetase-like protein (DUF2156 family)
MVRAQRGGGVYRPLKREESMSPLLIIGIVLVVVALLGFGGIVSALRSAAWLVLVVAIVVIVLSFIF